MLIPPMHVTCPNCKLANFNGRPKCTRCGADIAALWKKPDEPKASETGTPKA